MFSTVLVANRGEIARRVMRTLKKMGIRTVAVYSDADQNAAHVREADLAVRIGGAAATESYLSIPALIQACLESGAQAVHPGYGFLSENVDFARALEEAGIVFIGPSIESLHAMGDKIRSKQHVESHAVPTVPGIAEPGLDDDALLRAAENIGFPVLIKPSAGGGGKGMFAVESMADMPAALASARRTAASAFGDDTLFIERLVRNPRHIEVQVLADQRGNTVHLFERECSLQRRHQKVIEEAPSPLLTDLPRGAEIRERMGEAAVNAAKSVNYVGAGTVEFLVSHENPDEFFFMEMNTRLQVEHPVTEEVVRVNGERLDLVEWQVRVAAGEQLSLRQEELSIEGHAVEARVYAEDPASGFLPSVGEVFEFRAPAGAHVRSDSALDGPGSISANYDPMISKVIAWGEDRAQALATLDAALAETLVFGVRTNIDFLRGLIARTDVREGALNTNLIDAAGQPERGVPSEADLSEIAHAVSLMAPTAPRHSGGWTSPWQLGDGWCLTGATRAPHVVLDIDDQVRRVSVPGEQEVSGVVVLPHPTDPSTVWAHGASGTFEIRQLTRTQAVARSRAAKARETSAGNPEARSPMPGAVVSIAVQDGNTVTAGQTLVGVEAMKMEHSVVAEVSGTVKILVSMGDQVSKNQVLARIEAAA
ncbi:acetyl-CoA/propionyl-CoA carboxylase biotin carboxyl carrier protein [Neomicrococcus aestuarii]|uniref:Biotin-dependent 3-methylcrotonyl-coenzyme A carboxylase alpha1 subunit n=1 Tax=Neomicrococcus aestuarii TaxID=556325 RepID=A0A7W8TRI1_9MICC|nr:biotin carboxylase N-terminal domain-containing protein [Neomicrococcus aestuarii]MBB5511572.1 acetyl-CoA/propionyl-CoA carboxylase biotin carboxyl carrier protein [Neomicrococcus aestuarii]